MNLSKRPSLASTVRSFWNVTRVAPLLLVVTALAVASGRAHASPIVYTLSGSFSGSLGGVAFTNAVGVFSLTANTSGVQAQAGGYTNTAPGATFRVGTKVATFTSSTFGVESEYGAASFMDAAAGFAVGGYDESIPDAVLSQYGNPYSAMFVSYGSTAEMTSLGKLIITGASGNVVFQAKALAAATPEPSSLLLGGSGLLSLAAVVQRRRRGFHAA